MEINALRLEKEAKFRDFINQFLKNIGQDCDEEWWNNPRAADALSKLAGATQCAVSNSLELCMEDSGNLVIASWNGGTDARLLEQLIDSIEKRVREIVEAQKPAYEQKLARARAENKLLLKKIEINFLFFTKDFKSRLALEMKFAPNLWRKILRGFGVPVTTDKCAFIICQEYHGELARIRGINRHDSIQMPPISGRSNIAPKGKDVEDTIRSTVVTVQLKQLVELYNQVGDQLFKNNVRFGISEAFDVSKAMRETLEKEPQHFWFKNNGVTLLVEDPNFRLDYSDELRLGRLEASSPPLFSVVNGAQTITISAKYAFEQEYQQQNDPTLKAQCKERLENFAKAKVILRVIHIPIQPEQDETDEVRDQIQAAKNLANEISVSLNRQKPIRQEDIVFSTPFVQKLMEYLENPSNSAPFQLVRRGEESTRVPQLSLVDFSRGRLACAGWPGKARSASGNEIMQIDLNTKMFQNTTIFVEDWMAPDRNDTVVFHRCYGAVWFADQLTKIYVKTARSYTNENMNAQTAVKNGKWYFTALVVQLLNGFKLGVDGQPDFSEFNWSAQTFEEIIPQAIDAFSQMVVYCVGEGYLLNSNDFKNEECYQQLLEKLNTKAENTPFREFSELFLSTTEDKPSMEQNAKQQKITEIALGNNSSYISVKSGKEAFEKTVYHILQKYSPDPAQMVQYDSWLTTDSQKLALKKGNFNEKSPSILYCGQKYWIGCESISNDTKFSYIRSLCKLAQVPHGEISWLTGKSVRYMW